MTRSKVTDKRAREIIEMEGLGYAVRSYIGAEEMASPKTAELWRAAREALEALERHLGIEL